MQLDLSETPIAVLVEQARVLQGPEESFDGLPVSVEVFELLAGPGDPADFAEQLAFGLFITGISAVEGEGELVLQVASLRVAAE